MWSFLCKWATIWFWGGGGGGLENFVGTEYYFQHELGRNFFFGYTKARTFIFTRNEILKKHPPPQKKKTTDNNKEGGGCRNVAWFRRVAGQDLLYDFYIPGLKGLPWASSSRIVRPSVRPSVISSRLQRAIFKVWVHDDTVTKNWL